MNTIAITAGRAGLAFSLERSPDGFRAVVGLAITKRRQERTDPVSLSPAIRSSDGLGRYIDVLV